MIAENTIETTKIWSLLQEVSDPEIPVLSVVDLGIIRNVTATDDEVKIIITPTYSGCPAITRIEWDLRIKLAENGYKNVSIVSRLSPVWTTDWMSEQGKQKLKAYGIAPPNDTQSVCSPDLFVMDEAVQCPLCNSYNTKLVSRFGSTACKAFYQCKDCSEPFDYFKCH
ncbi:MAG: phenylacetate-CoA oxygenase subunit PaaJ [Chitinophagaceae bacterium]|nr:phenylacetate-CoA oxygenase subunit PaaJ [Chitinophagaceae bacterium]